MNMEEIWKDINGFEGLYQISNFGNVKSVKKSNKLIKPCDIKGYKSVKLYKYGYTRYFVHRLVAEAFIPNPENKKEVNHKNKIRNDNHVENLEWNTHSENMYHSFGYKYNNDKKFTIEDILLLKQQCQDGTTIKSIALLHNVRPIIIRALVTFTKL